MKEYSLLLHMKNNTRKIILHLLKHMELRSINQIAKILRISVGSSFSILKRLEHQHIVSCQKLGSGKFYALNLHNEETKKMCELFLLEERRELGGHAKAYAQELMKFDRAQLIILFGSVLHSKEFNDVDVLFICNTPQEATAFCLNLAAVRTKPIVPLILTKQALIRELKHKTTSITHLIKEGVVLKGHTTFVEILQHAKV